MIPPHKQVVFRFPYVVVRMGSDGTEWPVATVYAEDDGDANAWAYLLDGPSSFAYPQASAEELYEAAQREEFRATHAENRVLAKERTLRERIGRIMQAIDWLHGKRTQD